MIGFAWKSLWQEKTKLALSIGGVAFSILVILIIQGLFTGSGVQATLYINETNADIFVMQKGIANLHMASSFLPAGLDDRVKGIKGVQRAVGITYANTAPKFGKKRTYSYMIGFLPDEPIGGPWDLAKGTKNIGPDEVIVDDLIASQNNVGLGDTIEVMGQDFKIAGLSRNTFSIVSSITFLQRDTLARLNLRPNSISYILVQVKKGERPADVAKRIKDELGVNALTQREFSDSDRTMIGNMGINLIETMAFISLFVGLAVIGITVYTATLDRSRDYGVLKAIGASRPQLYGVVVVQALINAFFGFIAGLLLVFIGRVVIGRIFPELLIVLEPQVLGEIFVAVLAISILAAVIPARTIDSIDPKIAFERA